MFFLLLEHAVLVCFHFGSYLKNFPIAVKKEIRGTQVIDWSLIMLTWQMQGHLFIKTI